jgi:xylulokinase
MPEPSRDLLFGTDIGTTAVKGAVFDRAGALLATAAVEYPMSHPFPEWWEQDAGDWWACLLAVVERIGTEVDLRRVASVGVCSQVNTHLPVDADGNPLGPALIWRDQRCAGVAAAIDSSIDAETRQRLWGGPFKVDASFSLSRAAWFAAEQPDVWARTAWLMLPKDYVNLRLTGRAATDQMSPIGVVGPDGEYLAAVFDLVPGSADRHPPLRRFTEVLGPLVAPELPALAGVPVAVATMDAWGSIYGSRLVDHGAAMELAGTSEIVAVASREAHPVSGVISFPPIDGLTVHAGPTQAGGDAVRWWADLEGIAIEDLLASAAAAPAGAGGLVFHPYLAGERAPLWDADARASFIGVGAEHDRRHFARAVLEGVAFSARHVLETAEGAAGLRAISVNASGGGSRSELWVQIKADVFARRVDRLRVRDSGVLGAALMGAVAAGLFADLPTAARQTVEVERSFEPDPAASALYEGLYAIYLQAREESAVDAALTAWRDLHA